jgi:hypothetical protein
MILKEFIENFVCKNSLIRLWYITKGVHEMVIDGVSMEWETFKGEGIFGKFINNNVIGVTDILVSGHYTEAINIVIEKTPLEDYREQQINKIIC